MALQPPSHHHQPISLPKSFHLHLLHNWKLYECIIYSIIYFTSFDFEISKFSYYHYLFYRKNSTDQINVCKLSLFMCSIVVPMPKCFVEKSCYI